MTKKWNGFLLAIDHILRHGDGLLSRAWAIVKMFDQKLPWSVETFCGATLVNIYQTFGKCLVVCLNDIKYWAQLPL